MGLDNFKSSKSNRGRQSQLNIDEDELVQLYNSGKTSRQLADKYGCGKTTILRRLEKLDVEKREAKRIGTQIKTTPSKELAYFLGVLEGEGNIHTTSDGVQYTIGVTDEKFADEIERCMNCIGFNVVRYIQDKEDNKNATKDTIRLKGYSYSFFEWYCETNMINFLDKQLAVHFIRGFYDSEGWLTEQNDDYRRLGMNNTDTHLIDLVDHLLSQLNINMQKYTRVKKKKNHNPTVTLKTGKDEEIEKFLKKIQPTIKTEI